MRLLTVYRTKYGQDRILVLSCKILKMKYIIRLLSVVGIASLVACGAQRQESFDVDGQLAYCDGQVRRTLVQIGALSDSADYTVMPRNIMDSDTVWHCRKCTQDEWCSGFWPGVLWYDYELTGDTAILKQAESYTASLEYLSQQPAFDHDLGFLIFCSYGNGWRLTHNPHYKDVIIATADTLASLYNPHVGTILSWPRNVEILGGHNTIMDNMINLEMLFWAARNGGDHRLYDIAVRHAETTMAHQFRPDYSCYHVAVYDPETGEFIKGMTHQGYSDSSMWARGQAWAIYGYTTVYRETRDARFLDFAQKVTDIYLRRLPDDYIPYWDFDDPSIPAAPRDASAAAVVASALLELQQYVPQEKAADYRDAACKMLAELSSDRYQCGTAKPSFLRHSTGHHPAGSEIDASIIYADYYYIEALSRLKHLQQGETKFYAER